MPVYCKVKGYWCDHDWGCYYCERKYRARLDELAKNKRELPIDSIKARVQRFVDGK